MTPARLEITRPDDWHVHLRDGDALASVVGHTARRFARAIVMPNLKPPVATVAQAEDYRQRILASLPASSALAAFDPAQRRGWQASGGDDYELCFSASPRHRELVTQALDFAGVSATRIGRIIAGQGVKAFDADGKEWQPVRSGYQHFP